MKSRCEAIRPGECGIAAAMRTERLGRTLSLGKDPDRRVIGSNDVIAAVTAVTGAFEVWRYCQWKYGYGTGDFLMIWFAQHQEKRCMFLTGSAAPKSPL